MDQHGSALAHNDFVAGHADHTCDRISKSIHIADLLCLVLFQLVINGNSFLDRSAVAVDVQLNGPAVRD